MNNVHLNSYNYGGVDRKQIIIRIIVIISMIAIGAFIWKVSKENYAWEKNKTEIPYKHTPKMAEK